MKQLNLDNVRSADETTRLAPGGYLCGIKKVTDVPAKEYLEIEFDIAKGDFAHYYEQLCAKFGSWNGRFIKSYKDSALPFFKAFIEAIEASNPGFKWDGHTEQALERKWIGIVMGEEEYRKRDTGEIKTVVRAQQFLPIEDIKAGKFVVPEVKRLKAQDNQAAVALAGVTYSGNDGGFVQFDSNEDLPF